MNKALIISGSLVQDHEFIYPYYRLKEANFVIDVALLGGQPTQGILGTRIPPDKDKEVLDTNNIDINLYNLLIYYQEVQKQWNVAPRSAYIRYYKRI